MLIAWKGLLQYGGSVWSIWLHWLLLVRVAYSLHKDICTAVTVYSCLWRWAWSRKMIHYGTNLTPYCSSVFIITYLNVCPNEIVRAHSNSPFYNWCYTYIVYICTLFLKKTIMWCISGGWNTTLVTRNKLKRKKNIMSIRAYEDLYFFVKTYM